MLAMKKEKKSSRDKKEAKKVASQWTERVCYFSLLFPNRMRENGEILSVSSWVIKVQKLSAEIV